MTSFMTVEARIVRSKVLEMPELLNINKNMLGFNPRRHDTMYMIYQ